MKEPEKESHILRVLQQERDWEKTLKKKQDYTYLNRNSCYELTFVSMSGCYQQHLLTEV